MSHLIEGVDFQGKLVLTNSRFGLRPRFRQFLRSNTIESLLDKKGAEKVMESVCRQYTEQEQEKQRLEQTMFVDQKCSQLRKQLLVLHSRNISVDSFLNPSCVPLDYTWTGQDEETIVDLEGRCRTQINLKLGSFMQAKRIEEHKSQYRNWLSLQSRLHNPNLSKMSYLLEKINRKKHQTINTEPCEVKSKQQQVIWTTIPNKENRLIPSKCSRLRKNRCKGKTYFSSKPSNFSFAALS